MVAKTKQYDKNRYRKTYPRFRSEPRPGLKLESGSDVVLETVAVNFDGETTKTITLDGPYSSLPSVTVTPLGDINNVNVYITHMSLQSVPSGSGKKVFLTIEASTGITGIIHVQAILA